MTVQQEVHVLATLQIYQGLFNSFFMLIYLLLFVIYRTTTENVHGEKPTTKNIKPKAEKLMNIKKGIFKHVIKDRYWGNKAPLFMTRTTEFCHTLFALGNLLPRRMSTPPAVELASL